MSDQEQFYELLYYTLGHPDISHFIHQHIVDAFAAQKADKDTKPINIIFSLVGLYLYIEKDYSGRQVQQAHIRMSKNKRKWPTIKLPRQRGKITIYDVLNADPGKERDSVIKEWCISVWLAYRDSHETIADIVRTNLG